MSALSSSLQGKSIPYSNPDVTDIVKQPLTTLITKAAALRDDGHGARVSYSPKVFIPLTRLCRDTCRYCTFARGPASGEAYLLPEQILEIARLGVATGCREALFTLGDKPELKYEFARRALDQLGYATTVEYLHAMCALVWRETGLLPHVNAGVMTENEIASLREVSVSQGLMLESSSERLCRRDGPHFGSPDKLPALRLAMIEAAGRLHVPFTTGLLIGIGETVEERIEALLKLADLHRRHGHIQEIIIQNFRAKSRTAMADSEEPTVEEILRTIAIARLIFGPKMNLQAPPNLSPDLHHQLLDAGINDWGGISSVTPDHVNPEAPWPEIAQLERSTAHAGKCLVPRLAIYPSYALDPDHWLDPRLHTAVLRSIDADGFAHDTWAPGKSTLRGTKISAPTPVSAATRAMANLLRPTEVGRRLSEENIISLFAARGKDFEAVCTAANVLRKEATSDTVTYVVNRNINYTNICSYACRFCAFSKGKTSEALRGPAYDISDEEIARRVAEAWARGATEICMQGGIHPRYTGHTYLGILATAKTAVPEIHVHAFSPLEVYHGAKTLNLSVSEFLSLLQEAGLSSLPGTAAEILDDEVRSKLCPDKLTTTQWLDIVEAAHRRGLRTTATIMFGHIDRAEHWARHLLHIRDLQERTGGFTEFVPLPFVHMEAPLYLAGSARKGPSLRETILMHAVSRLVLNPLIPNIQVSWVKLGIDGVRACLAAGANDLGGTLMNESISRAAGAEHGQELPPPRMDALIKSLNRVPRQRTTLYADVPSSQRRASYAAKALAPVVLGVRQRPRNAVSA